MTRFKGGRNENNYTVLRKILQSKKGKRRQPMKMGRELELKDMGSGKFGPCPPPPTPPFLLTSPTRNVVPRAIRC